MASSSVIVDQALVSMLLAGDRNMTGGRQGVSIELFQSMFMPQKGCIAYRSAWIEGGGKAMDRIWRHLSIFERAHEAWLHGRTQAFDPRRLYCLTRRELEIFYLLGAGASNTDLMARLRLSEQTVKGHVSHIMAKLSMTRTEVVAYSARVRG